MALFKYAAMLIGAGVLGCWLLASLGPEKSASAETTKDVTYLCKETKQLVKAPLAQIPATNPATGRATLYRALYCPLCKKWRPVPPADVFSGNPLTYHCPKHRQPMSAVGPMDKTN